MTWWLRYEIAEGAGAGRAATRLRRALAVFMRAVLARRGNGGWRLQLVPMHSQPWPDVFEGLTL